MLFHFEIRRSFFWGEIQGSNFAKCHGLADGKLKVKVRWFPNSSSSEISHETSLQLTMIVLGQNTLAADGAQVDSKLIKWAIVQGVPSLRGHSSELEKTTAAVSAL